ncbi:MAG: DUF551 domain-containing protein [Clostridiales bacterium]|nr:DUF551 domain-containing protein [Clostridiales bacterium]
MRKYIDADVLMDKLRGNVLVDVTPALEDAIAEMPAADVEPVRKWIPCSERLPKDNSPVLIAYCDKDDRSDIDIAISQWSELYFGGNPTGRMWWLPPFDYFTSNYDVIAWQPLPEPPKMDGGSE